MNDFSVKPIEEFPAYLQGTAVFGIPSTAKRREDLIRINPVIEIEGKEYTRVFQTFFTIDGIIYFSIMQTFPDKVDNTKTIEITKYCSQENGAITEIDETDFPEMPESLHVTYSDNMYKIETGQYKIDGEMQGISTIKRGPLSEAYLKIDGFFRINTGIWFSVPVTFQTRSKGLYYWPDDSPKIKAMDNGRIW